MKTILPARFRFLGSALLLLMLGACDRAPSGSPANASYKATAEFWDAIHQPIMKQPDIDAMRQLKIGDPDPAHARMVREGFRGLARSISERNKRITSLPLLNVDADAVGYAAKVAEFRKELGELCEAVAGKTEADARIPDELMLGLLLSLARHAKDREGVFLNAAKDSVGQTGDALSNARAGWEALAARVKGFGGRGDSLQIEEMNMRAKLAARYGHEFPAAATYPSVVGQPAPKP